MVQITPLSIDGAYSISPVQHGDDRGTFLEFFRGDLLAEAIGRPFTPVQGNRSISSKGVVRGIHFADVPAGQAKYVTVTSGSITDYIIDIRVGSPTFGQWVAVELDDVTRGAVFIAEGLGHLFVATSDQAAVSYLTNDVYRPGKEHTVSPLDADIALELPFAADALLLSPRDTSAPSLSEARDSGLLPDYEVCRAHYAALAGE
nr:dTDP-4-dehydrorhamnose 3,5-epimerase [Galbitalea soli]